MPAMKFTYLLAGAASVLDVSPAPRNYIFERPQPNLSDIERLRGDAELVGGHLWASVRQLSGEVQSNVEKEQVARANPAAT